MLSREINDDIGRGFVEIQRWVDDEHTQNEALSGERDSLAVRVKSLEAQVAGLETECTALRSDVQTLRSAWAVLEEKVQTEWELSNSIGLATWEALEALEGAVVQLSVVPPVRHHRPIEIDITLERQRCTGRCVCRWPVRTVTIVRRWLGRRP